MRYPHVALLVSIIAARVTSPSPVPHTNHDLFPRGFPIADLVNEGREVTETLAGWFDRSMRDSRGFVYPFDEEIIPEGLRDAGEEMANLVTDALEGDEEAIASIGDERMAALIAAGAASKRLPFEIPFTREQAKILYAFAEARDWRAYRELRAVKKVNPALLKEFDVDLTPLEIQWKKPALLTGLAVAGVGGTTAAGWALSYVLKTASSDGSISTEIQQMIVRILEDNPEERDVLLKQIDEAPISTKLRTQFHEVVDDEAK